jgi:16S rRNA (cytosine1402-N4)-methyltransferase
MVHEVIANLNPSENGVYVDGTVGSGGHSEAIAQKIGSRGHLICLDRDPAAIRLSKERLQPFGRKVILIHSNYAAMEQVLNESGYEKVDGILLDLGLSSYQIEESGRGFSFQKDEPLDMRMNPGQELTAELIVNRSSVNELEKLLREFGEEKKARLIAKTIERERRKASIRSAAQLSELIQSTVYRSHRHRDKHPATLTFQALRIAVNRELENLSSFLEKVPVLIQKGGRLVVLSYHSLEDRLVKKAMIGWENPCTCPPDLPECVCGKLPLFKRPFKKAGKPSQKEISRNPRARSARLRVAERI